MLVAASFLGLCQILSAGDIQAEVQQRLLNLSRYTVFDYLGDLVNGPEVTLVGQVVDPALKDNATKAVQAIPGVTAVLNEIEVLPRSASDDAIRAAEYRVIYSDPELRRYGNPVYPSIRIIVKDGEVSLEGIVASELDRETAYLCANSVAGITKVNQDLLIEQGVSE